MKEKALKNAENALDKLEIKEDIEEDDVKES